MEVKSQSLTNIECLICSLKCELPFLFLPLHQASQLGVYRAFVDNYELAVETAEKCCQANTQFAEISEVRRREERMDNNSEQG